VKLRVKGQRKHCRRLFRQFSNKVIDVHPDLKGITFQIGNAALQRRQPRLNAAFGRRFAFIHVRSSCLASPALAG